MKTTANYGLKKPEGTDVVNIDDLNTNADTIDAELKKRVMTSDYTRQTVYAVDTGSANTYVITLNPAPTAYTDGMAVTVKIKTTNTGASTLNINGLGAKTILDSHGNALAAGKLKAGLPYTFRYNGTNFILQGEGGEYGTATQADVLNTATFGTEQGVKQGTMDLSNLTPENVRENVNINGVTGTLEEKESIYLPLQDNTLIRYIKGEGIWSGYNTDTAILSDNNGNIIKTVLFKFSLNGTLIKNSVHCLYVDTQYIGWTFVYNYGANDKYCFAITDKNGNILKYTIEENIIGLYILNSHVYVVYYTYSSSSNPVYMDIYDMSLNYISRIDIAFFTYIDSLDYFTVAPDNKTLIFKTTSHDGKDVMRYLHKFNTDTNTYSYTDISTISNFDRFFISSNYFVHY